MKHGKVLLVIGICLFLAHLAYSQEPTIVLKHKEAGPHQRPLVSFNHENHAGTIECIGCHHDYDQFGNNRGGEDKAQSCTSCHSNPSQAQKKLLAVTEAFHAQCKKCHDKLREDGKPTGPVMCGECHVSRK